MEGARTARSRAAHTLAPVAHARLSLGGGAQVQEFLHVKPGKGSAFVRSKLKNLENGNVLEKTWKSGEAFPDAQVDKEDMQYSYENGDDLVFMNMESFEEERIPRASIDKADFIKEEMSLQARAVRSSSATAANPPTLPTDPLAMLEISERGARAHTQVLKWRGKAIDVQVPKTVQLVVTQTDPGAKGNTAQGRTEKPATLETGAGVNVPIFIEEGETIKVDTDERKYTGRLGRDMN